MTVRCNARVSARRKAPASARQPTRLGIHIPGIVQGIGFRPWVFRLAVACRVTGFVRNMGSGISIEAQTADAIAMDEFTSALSKRTAREKWNIVDLPSIEDECDFRIAESATTSHGDGVDPVLSADRAICEHCHVELLDPSNRRYRYPFISCAECGPRQSVTFQLPFDRKHTSWAEFPMCANCRSEYADPNNRRFHAQTVSCQDCGPELELWDNEGRVLKNGADAIASAASRIRDGEIVAVKGIGGFHLIADATSELALKKLRDRKHREAKPLAVMVRSLAEAQKIALWDEVEIKALCSPVAPIVLVRRREDRNIIAPNVAPGLARLGVMLASTGLHYLLLSEVGRPLVATSGNLSAEPICTDEHDAVVRLDGVADAFLIHTLKIQNGLDDSIVQSVSDQDETPICIRRSRGYPLQIDLDIATSEAILGAGADLKSAIAVFQGGKRILSPHLGSLASVESVDAYEQTLQSLPKFFGITPSLVVNDLHPDYRSTRLATEHATKLGVPVLSVQHHCAHLASAVAENGLINEAVLGVVWDGTGFGLDGTSWGGEFLFFSKNEIKRTGSLRLFPLLGGEAAIREPKRVALALLWQANLKNVEKQLLGTEFRNEELAVFAQCERSAPLTSSVGRLFDGIAALLGIRSLAQYEGQAAMELQALAEKAASKIQLIQLDDAAEISRDWNRDESTGLLRWDWRPLVREIVEGRLQGEKIQDLAFKFHLKLSRVVVEQAKLAADSHGIKNVVLAGGVFQNALLMNLTIHALRHNGFEVYWNRIIPPNDAGIAIGQVICASVYPDVLKKFQTMISP